MEDVGTARFSDEEVKRLRQYLLKGGFIWVDDFWGDEAWWQWVEEIQRVLPTKEFPIRPITPDHPIFRTLFQVSKAAADSLNRALAAQRRRDLRARRGERRAADVRASAMRTTGSWC